LRDSSEAENREPQLHNKGGRLTTLRDSSEAENGEPQLHNKGGAKNMIWRLIYHEN